MQDIAGSCNAAIVSVYRGGMEQDCNIGGSCNAAIDFKQSSTWINALVIISFKHCTAFVDLSSSFKS